MLIIFNKDTCRLLYLMTGELWKNEDENMNISKYVIHSQGENCNLIYNTKEDFLIRYSNKDFDLIG